jgi:hypothetical protein
MEATDEVYDDMNPEQIETLPDSQPHRDVDLEIINADKQGRYPVMSSVVGHLLYLVIFRLREDLHYRAFHHIWYREGEVIRLGDFK